MVNKERILISLVEDKDSLLKALKFIEMVAFRSHRASPPPPPEALFAAYYRGEIVGTIGIEFGSNHKPLPIEGRWQFDRLKTPLPFHRNEIVEIGRWMATKPGVSAALFYAATFFALSRRKYYCMAEMKSKIAQHSTGLGFIMLPVQNAKIFLDKIPQSGLPYYTDDPPALYMLRLEQMHQSIKSHTPPLDAISFYFPATP